MWFYWKKINLHLTNIFLNFHDEILLWSTTSEGKSHVLPRLYLEFRPDDSFNTNLAAWKNTRFGFNCNCDVVHFMKRDHKGS